MEECPLVLGGGGGGVLPEAGLMTQLPEVDPVELSLLTEGLCWSTSVTVHTPEDEFFLSTGGPAAGSELPPKVAGFPLEPPVKHKWAISDTVKNGCIFRKAQRLPEVGIITVLIPTVWPLLRGYLKDICLE